MYTAFTGEVMAVVYSLSIVLDKIAEARERLAYWENLKKMMENPLFAEISPTPSPQPSKMHFVPTTLLQTSSYGEIKRLTYECLPVDDPMTPQQLAAAIAERGFVFRTKTPAVSVNDTLQVLQKEQKVKFVGRAPSHAGLWLKVIPKTTADAPPEEVTS